MGVMMRRGCQGVEAGPKQLMKKIGSMWALGLQRELHHFSNPISSLMRPISSLMLPINSLVRIKDRVLIIHSIAEVKSKFNSMIILSNSQIIDKAKASIMVLEVKQHLLQITPNFIGINHLFSNKLCHNIQHQASISVNQVWIIKGLGLTQTKWVIICQIKTTTRINKLNSNINLFNLQKPILELVKLKVYMRQ